MKQPITPKEKHDAEVHDGMKYLIWLALAVVCLVPPVTPVGVFLFVLLLWHLFTE